MEYFGESNKLTRILSNERLRVKAYGKNVAIRLRERLEEFSAADNLSDISHYPPARLHRLQGNRSQQFAVDVSVNWRMIFEGYDSNDELTIKESEIVTISVVSIEDYH